MKARGEKKYTIVDAVLEERTQAWENGFLAKVDKCVNWLKLRTLINKKYTKTQNAVGNPAYDSLMLFKILLLQQWYYQSDRQIEERINDLAISSVSVLNIPRPTIVPSVAFVVP